MRQGGVGLAELVASSAAAKAAARSALVAHLALLDRHGRILSVNEAWKDFARRNGGYEPASLGPGADYLAPCRTAADTDALAARALAGINAVLAGELAQFSMEYPCSSDGVERRFVMTVAPLGNAGEAAAMVSHLDITIIRQAEREAISRERHYRAIFDNAAVGIGEFDGDGRWLRGNDRLQRIAARGAAGFAATSRLDLLHPADRDAAAAQLARMRRGAVGGERLEQRWMLPDGSFAWVAATTSCVRGADGAIACFVVVVEDIAERKAADLRQRTLLHELAHRGKNLLAVIQSIAMRSLNGQGGVAQARGAFLGRLQALAKTYGTLVDQRFDGAHLEAILDNELAPFNGRVQASGPSLVLGAKAAQTFTLVVHELATNAAKYGAMSAITGRLAVRWEILGQAEARRLRFTWQERGGPMVGPPERSGFGTTLISVIAGAEFGCTPELIYAPEGFRYRIEVPLARLEPAPLADLAVA